MTDSERLRLAQANDGSVAWRDWGPYVAERAWGSVREDYSADGDAWASFPHDHARSRTYRWNDDGMAGFSDVGQKWCLALALHNGVDPILKERMFGLTGPEGNHGEDVKEYWWYLDSTPTHSFNTWRYHYPQAEFPYDDLIATNARRSKLEPEYELVDTGIFDDSRYWVVTVDYAKEGPHDLLMQITLENAGSDAATIEVLPTLWYRNTWSWGYEGQGEKPRLHSPERAGSSTIVGEAPDGHRLVLIGEPGGHPLFCDNETNTARLFASGAPDDDARESPAFPKDGINDFIVAGAATVNPANEGTKAALHYSVEVAPGESRVIRVRLTGGFAEQPSAPVSLDTGSFDTGSFDELVSLRKQEADEFYAGVTPADASDDEARVLRQAFAGLLWSKQFFHFNVDKWLAGDPASPPPPPERLTIRNQHWRHLDAHDVILMPDPWEYPWFAAWDLAFHCVTLAHIDPEFAKAQLILMLREWYMHPSGQLPAYEWNFSDVNPPTHAWAALQVFLLDGGTDFSFLARVFHKLLMNFTWWTNNKDHGDNNLFEGGFMGLDNIAPLDRSKLPPEVGILEQADATAWMAMYALDLLNIAVRLASNDRSYEDVATKFFEHFLQIADSANDTALWDDTDAYFYDVLHLADGRDVPLKVRSLVGLVPVAASLAFVARGQLDLPEFKTRVAWFLTNHPRLAKAVHGRHGPEDDRYLLALVSPERLHRIVTKVFNEQGMLSHHGIRGISAYHREHPFSVEVNGQTASVDYEPAESTSGLFGGNSNWRGPVWFPLNVLLIEALRNYSSAVDEPVGGDPGPQVDPQVEFPLGSGVFMSLDSVADALSHRLISVFLPGPDGRRPADARYELLSTDPRWKDNVFFYEYFDGDTGQGLGASHQTGWTALVAHLILTTGSREAPLTGEV
ncbi:MGH1-like glycoside hydrolase domain-containing protein [Subtercola frigoramans]|uniref:Mannosylglycerate hydrolase MGH1-like glycoside hydrolase domain-containing protein n=1 Tax=Subtercola frigoramans TaxID=120298 RepID=A0ABS2L4U0_9MICO|nr:glucosidase [Subtercola frigoramans]MBM7472118.1 hypothetical protein [Subtercola frigoramans]